MQKTNLLLFILIALFAIDIVLLAYSALRAPYPAIVPLGSPTAYRNIYIHVPIAWACYALFTGAFVSAILYLLKENDKYDKLTYVFALTGVMYSIATLITGSAWAWESWGTPWNWDPRETGVLLLFIAYLVYFAIRASIPDPERAKRLSAVYAVAAYAMVPISFLAPMIAGYSLHPTPEATRQFLARPEVRGLFNGRALVVTAASIIMAYLATKNVFRRFKRLTLYTAATLALVGLAIGLYSLTPYFTAKLARVVNATVNESGYIMSVKLDNGEVLEFPKGIASPITPAVVNNTPTVIGHIVNYDLLKTEHKLVVVNHWCVGFNVIVYLLVLSATLAILTRLRL